MNFLSTYTRWLHTRWPAGSVEKLPTVQPDGSTSVPGLYVVGDLTGIPLLKFSADTGARAVHTAKAQRNLGDGSGEGARDLVIIGGGVSGFAAALEAKKLGLDFELLEASEPFSTLVNFPKGKPIYTYPTEMTPAGEIQFEAEVKEPLLEELHAQTLAQGVEPRLARAESVQATGKHLEVRLADGEPIRARAVIVGIGRSGNFRKLGVPGEDSGKVFNRLHDPKEFAGKDVLVVGGGDSAMEAAVALAQCGAKVTLSYRKAEFSRPKPENVAALEQLAKDPMAAVAVERPSSDRVTTSTGDFMSQHRRPGSIRMEMDTQVQSIEAGVVWIKGNQDGAKQEIPNDAVFAMIGREAPLDFFRKSGVAITGEMRGKNWAMLAAFVAFCTFVYLWKLGGDVTEAFKVREWFPFNVAIDGDSHLLETLRITLTKPGFYYTTVYSLLIAIFGYRRIRRRKTPYVTLQTVTLTLVQVIPLWLMPYILLPWMGHAGWFDEGFLKTVADGLFPVVGYDHGRAYWHAFGLILAWPLFIWNFMTSEPMAWWLVIGCVQTFVLIPLMVWKWGKGAYCGWICSCGALAETLGDTHRHKMPHGPFWNRLNMLGQVILWIAMLMFAFRVIGWIWPGGIVFQSGTENEWSLDPGVWADSLLSGFTVGDGWLVNYKGVVDLLLAGILGVGLYFWFSGRTWCRFACPLAALMHIYARFSKFRIFADKKKCISCNVCTSVCHQGIDIMNFANKGLPMEDPECVRCSACVQGCPTGVLSFGEIDKATGDVRRLDRLPASPVQMAEK